MRAPGWPTTDSAVGRQIDPCEADSDVVVQQRVGQTHVFATAVDVHVTGRDGDVVLRSVMERR